MSIEVEQKFRVRDMPTLELRLSEFGATACETLVQVDCYYAHPQRDFATTDEALRLRRVGPHNYLTYKGPKLDTTTKTRREIELPLAPGQHAADDAAAMLEALGFHRVSHVRKRRATWKINWRGRPIEVALDDVQGLGDFVELEIVATPEDVDAARAAIHSLAQRLELGPSERRSYLELLLASGQRSG